MRKLILMLVLLGLTATAFAQNDSWIVGIGQLQALWNQSLVDEAFAYQMAQHPNDGIEGKFQALYTGRQDVDNRIVAAVVTLCNHDPAFCANTFQIYGLRWKQNP